MSHILEFRITGLAGRKDVCGHKLNRDLNVFFGLNGSGKTSLLRILDSAMSGDTDILRIVPFESAEVTIYSVQYQKEFVRTISKAELLEESPSRKPHAGGQPVPTTAIEEITEMSLQQYYVRQRRVRWNVRPSDPDAATASWAHFYLPTWRLYPGSEFYAPHFRGEPGFTIEREYDLDRFFGRKLGELWARYSNRLLSEIQKIHEDGIASILSGILAPQKRPKRSGRMDPKVTYQRVAAFLERQGSPNILGSLDEFKRRYNSETQIRRIAENIEAIERQIEQSKVSRNRLEQLIRDMFSGDKTILFRDTGIDVETGEGQDIGLASLSSGEKQALWIFIVALLAGENTVLIDEPEISMHVDWQEQLLSGMQQLNADAQIVVATHSPGIMANIPDSNIFRL